MLSHLRDIETTHLLVKNLHKNFNSEEFQKASKIDESMQRLNLFESEINAISDAIRRWEMFVHYKLLGPEVKKGRGTKTRKTEKIVSTNSRFSPLIYSFKGEVPELSGDFQRKVLISSKKPGFFFKSCKFKIFVNSKFWKLWKVRKSSRLKIS